jgi:hypothetical protein
MVDQLFGLAGRRADKRDYQRLGPSIPTVTPGDGDPLADSSGAATLRASCATAATRISISSARSASMRVRALSEPRDSIIARQVERSRVLRRACWWAMILVAYSAAAVLINLTHL